MPDSASEPERLSPGSSRVLTIPNVVTFVRLLCVPLFLWLVVGTDHFAIAAWLLAALGATDWVDGYLARHLHQGSELGKVLDPTADRLMLLAATVAILAVDMPGIVKIFVVIVLVREAVVAAATLALAAAGARRIDVLWVGKAGTLAVMFSLPMLLLAAHVDGFWHAVLLVGGWGFGVPGTALGYYAAAKYVPAARLALRDGRSARLAKVAT
ncbi:MAG TPA: CDP-alcohol phosphatidyltransferase family protein [Acidimicrobiia bacterium]|jgi:cardiolipin synthase|nr:CDP-alcohol phosphatidyltransferase family protein [Acidimicrobiia bacterium]